jgi:CDP-ribitol ribitolphosphotransferase
MANLKLREYVKTIMQTLLLPLIYRMSKKKTIHPNLVILADAHHDGIPYSMRQLAEALDKQPDFQVQEICKDYQKGSYLSVAKSMLAFMRSYANAGYVVICDNHLPVASCKKRSETKVIQLWHSGGALKRFGYDAPGNVPDSYHGGNVYANYDLITVSADYAIEPFVRAMKTDRTKVQPIGISRTDWYFDEEKKQRIRERFAREYPQAQGKRIILWAPTFRGSAGDPKLAGAAQIEWLRQQLAPDEYLIVKLHPHARKKYHIGDAPMLTEELLVVTDVLISDYSSIIYDYACFGKPLVLFTPDFEEYERTCGFYEDYESIPAYRASSGEELLTAIRDREHFDASAMQDFWKRTMSACDGHATERIIQWMRAHT